MQNSQIFKDLSKIREHHQKAINLSRSLSNTYVMIVLLHFLSASITICISCVTILLADGFDKLIFVNYIMAATTQVFLYALGGEVLVISSTSIKFAAYQTDWYKCDQKIGKSLLFIITRAGRSSGVDVPFFEVSLETFASVSNLKVILLQNLFNYLFIFQILATAGSYITILNKFL